MAFVRHDVDPVRLLGEARFLKHDADLHPIGRRERKRVAADRGTARLARENRMIERHFLQPMKSESDSAGPHVHRSERLLWPVLGKHRAHGQQHDRHLTAGAKSSRITHRPYRS